MTYIKSIDNKLKAKSNKVLPALYGIFIPGIHAQSERISL